MTYPMLRRFWFSCSLFFLAFAASSWAQTEPVIDVQDTPSGGVPVARFTDAQGKEWLGVPVVVHEDESGRPVAIAPVRERASGDLGDEGVGAMVTLGWTLQREVIGGGGGGSRRGSLGVVIGASGCGDGAGLVGYACAGMGALIQFSSGKDDTLSYTEINVGVANLLGFGMGGSRGGLLALPIGGMGSSSDEMLPGYAAKVKLTFREEDSRRSTYLGVGADLFYFLRISASLLRWVGGENEAPGWILSIGTGLGL